MMILLTLARVVIKITIMNIRQTHVKVLSNNRFKVIVQYTIYILLSTVFS
jgi:hypothetical protein